MAKSSKSEEEVPRQINPSTGTERSDVIIPESGNEESVELTVTKKLTALFTLQAIDTQIDKIRAIRGELPLEVEDLEDEIEGLETRIEKFRQELRELEAEITGKKAAISESQELIKKYEGQQMNVRNNREYDSLSKEIEFQTLEVQLSEKKIREYTAAMELKSETVKQVEEELEERRKDLEAKKNELDDIVAETKKEEELLLESSEKQKTAIESRLMTAYQRIRENARNGLAVVPVERDACGGCFNKIPPQRQLDIRLHKKIIVCEYCGRILVDSDIVSSVELDF
ncbi:MAG: C4-type zinc ribbon domain-containing protein [Bacteroides sp.]|jgi:predicted  nucleic acid-binding Zn-ribbon protein|nr:C4-type zinc ribbon domain-containing protein [Bacteroides sp.]